VLKRRCHAVDFSSPYTEALRLVPPRCDSLAYFVGDSASRPFVDAEILRYLEGKFDRCCRILVIHRQAQDAWPNIGGLGLADQERLLPTT
jgi:hypothetical protein